MVMEIVETFRFNMYIKSAISISQYWTSNIGLLEYQLYKSHIHIGPNATPFLVAALE